MPMLKNARHEEFCQCLARRMSATQAYISAGYSENGAAQGAERLLRNVEVRKRANELVVTFAEESITAEIGLRSARLQALNTQYVRMQNLMNARAEDMQGIPGGPTGLLVRQMKSIGFGENNQLVEEYAFDAALNRELRETMKQAAQELGQWTEKKELTGRDGQPIAVNHDIRDRLASDPELRAIARRASSILAGGPGTDGPKAQ